jgi:DNA-binding transcriptional regulator YiaG
MKPASGAIDPLFLRRFYVFACDKRDMFLIAGDAIKRRQWMYDLHLRSRRERCGWSRAWLAQALGSTVDLITQWEEGVSLPSLAL